MKMQCISRSAYSFLPSGILIVEPDEALLAARTMLLAAADYYVGVSASAHTELLDVQSEGHEVSVAVLSESLGHALLSATAQVVQEHWRHARILILGRGQAAIEDNLYDARIDDAARPEDLLAALVALSEDPENERARPANAITGRSKLFDVGNWLVGVTGRNPTNAFASRDKLVLAPPVIA